MRATRELEGVALMHIRRWGLDSGSARAHHHKIEVHDGTEAVADSQQGHVFEALAHHGLNQRVSLTYGSEISLFVRIEAKFQRNFGKFK